MKRHATTADLFAHLTPEARARLAAAQQDPRAAALVRGAVIRPSTLVPVPLDRTSPHWWACERGHDNWGLRASGCGPCEAARFGYVDLTALGGGR